VTAGLLSIKLGSFCNTCVAAVYFSPRLLCRFDLVVRAISIRLRMEIGGDLLTRIILFFSTLLWLGSERNLYQAANRFRSARLIGLLRSPLINSPFQVRIKS
jgi:hypothetical protein